MGIRDKRDAWNMFLRKFKIDFDDIAQLTYLNLNNKIWKNREGEIFLKEKGADYNKQLKLIGKNIGVTTETLELLGEEEIKEIVVRAEQLYHPDIRDFSDIEDRIVNYSTDESIGIAEIATDLLTLQGAANYTEERLIHGTMNLNEFIAVGAESYIKGGKYFIQVYVPVIGQTQAETFYTRLKDQLFLQKEYLN